MATNAIDFSDLGGRVVQPSQQAGIDFSDLGGKVVQSAAQAPPEGAAARFGKNALSGFGVTSDEEAKDFFRHPLNTLQKILTGNRDLGNQAYKEIGQGNYSQGIPDLAYAAIPFLGPTLSKSAHQLTTGDIAGGLGTMTGAGAQVALGAKMAPGSKIAPTPEELSSQTLASTPKPQPAPVGGLRQSAATGMIQKLIKPMKNDVAFGKDPAGAIVREGLTANDLSGLGDQVYARAKQVGQQIDDTLQDPAANAKTLDVSQSLAPIDTAMQTATKTGNKGLYDRLGELKKQLTNDWGPDEETGSIKPIATKNMQMTPYEATQFKRNVGDMTQWTGNDPFENDLNAVKGKIFGNLKDQVNQAVPEVQALNSRYSDLVGAGKAIERRVPIDARNSEWSLSDIGTGIGALHFGGPAGVAAVAGKKLLSSTAFKTRAAQALAGPRTPRASLRPNTGGLPPALGASAANDDYQYLSDPQAWNRSKKF